MTTHGDAASVGVGVSRIQRLQQLYRKTMCNLQSSVSPNQPSSSHYSRSMNRNFPASHILVAANIIEAHQNIKLVDYCIYVCLRCDERVKTGQMHRRHSQSTRLLTPPIFKPAYPTIWYGACKNVFDEVMQSKLRIFSNSLHVSLAVPTTTSTYSIMGQR